MLDVKVLIGLSKEAAEEKVVELKGVVRVIAEDGEQFMHTMDMRSDRVNLEIVKGKIVKAFLG